MAIVGPDGNDMPEELADGVTGTDWVAINARAYTAYQREAFDTAFGLGLAHGLSNPTIPSTELQGRIRASFVGTHLNVESIRLTVAGRVYDINLALLVQED